MEGPGWHNPVCGGGAPELLRCCNSVALARLAERPSRAMHPHQRPELSAARLRNSAGMPLRAAAAAAAAAAAPEVALQGRDSVSAASLLHRLRAGLLGEAERIEEAQRRAVADQATNLGLHRNAARGRRHRAHGTIGHEGRDPAGTERAGALRRGQSSWERRSRTTFEARQRTQRRPQALWPRDRDNPGGDNQRGHRPPQDSSPPASIAE